MHGAKNNNNYIPFVATRLHLYEFCRDSLGQRSAIAERVFKKPDKNGGFYET